MTPEAIGYRHTIIEPDGQENSVFSSSEANPWSHWVQKHRDECKYSVVALYPEAAIRSAERDALERAAKWHDDQASNAEAVAMHEDRLHQLEPGKSTLWGTASAHRYSAIQIRSLAQTEGEG